MKISNKTNKQNDVWSKTITDGESDKKINIDNLKMFRLLGGMPNVTFQVDMTDVNNDNITINSDGVHIAGSFNNWDPTVTQMSNISSNFNIYEITLTLDEGSHEFKFINGNSWEDSHEIFNQDDANNYVNISLDSDGNNVNRIVTVGSNDMKLLYRFNDPNPDFRPLTSTLANALIVDGHAEIPYGYTSIADYVLAWDSGLTSVFIPNSVTSIGDYVFAGASLTSVTIPNSVTSIGNYVFYNCTSLETITVDANNNNYSSDEGILFNKGKSVFVQFPISKKDNGNLLTNYTIPNSVTSIVENAFARCTSLTSVTIPDSVTTIGSFAFSYSDLTSINIGNSLTTIGDYAFRNCKSLTSVTIPNSVTTIGNDAFYNCSGLTSINIGNSVETIGNRVFNGCNNLTEINVDTNNNNYSSDNGILFNNNKSMLVQYPAGKTGTNYTIPDSVITIEGYAFYYCESLTSVTIPNSVTTIGSGAFSRASLTSVTIPDSVTSIGNYVFYNCTNLASVTLYEGITTFGSDVFLYSSLSEVTVYYTDIQPDYDSYIPVTINYEQYVIGDENGDGVVNVLDIVAAFNNGNKHLIPSIVDTILGR